MNYQERKHHYNSISGSVKISKLTAGLFFCDPMTGLGATYYTMTGVGATSYTMTGVGATYYAIRTQFKSNQSISI